jgi:O-antigen/teichoic acid export membrane protein
MISKLKPKSEFTRNVLTLMTGTTIAQVIPIAISPILTRLYSPEDFGEFALFIAIASIFGFIANGRYEMALMLPKKDENANKYGRILYADDDLHGLNSSIVEVKYKVEFLL